MSSIEIKKGDKVKIRRGAEIIYQHNRHKTASRTHTITVESFRPAKTISLQQALFDRSIRAKLIEMGHDMDTLEKEYDAGLHADMMMELAPPMVIWAGGGGYWNETAVSNIETI